MPDVTHDGFQFTHIAGAIEHGPIAQGVQVLSYAGVDGSSHLVGGREGRPLRCRYTLQGFETLDELLSSLRNIDTKQGELSGTLTGPNGETYEECTFIGFVREGPPVYSAGGNQGWVQRGTLNWIQRKIGS